MSGNLDTARAFFEACETGMGWDACRPFCHADAGFSAQSGALADISSLADYADWMRGLLTMLTDGTYELTALAEDAERDTVVASAIFTGTHDGADGPVPATGQTARSDYAYVMRFSDSRVNHMTKIWNDGWALKQLGWA